MTSAHATTTSSKEKTQSYTSKSMEEVFEALNGKVYFKTKYPFKVSQTNYQLVDATLCIDSTNNSDKAYFESPEGSVYLKKYGSESYYMYEYNDDLNLYDSVDVILRDEVEDIINIQEVLSIACGLTIKYDTKVENFPFINRTTTQYFFNYNEGNNEITEQYIFDNLTGICLKHSIISSANPGVEIVNQTTFEVLDFSTTTGVDSCFATQEARIEVTPWDTEFFNSNGLTDKSGGHVDLADIAREYGNNAPDIVLSGAESYYNDGIMFANRSGYSLISTDKNNSEFAIFIIENLYVCGAKYDALGNEKSIDDLYVASKDNPTDDFYSTITFDAYTDQAAYNNLKFQFKIEEDNTYIVIGLIDNTNKPGNTYLYTQPDYKKFKENTNSTYLIEVPINYHDTSTDEYLPIPLTLGLCGDDIYTDEPVGTFLYVYCHDTLQDKYYYAFYSYNGEEYNRLENSDINPEDLDINAMNDIIETVLDMNIIYTSKEIDITFLERECVKFINEKTVDGVLVREEYIIDKGTGICLKRSIIRSDSSAPVVNSNTFTVSRFELGNSVTTFINGEKDKIVE